MGGGLMQLVAYGAQDIYLTGNPQITFFKIVYRRHTNFSMESIKQTFSGTPGFGKSVTAIISRNGDLVNRMYLEHTADITGGDVCVGVDYGSHLMKECEIEIGGQTIDKHYGHWNSVYSQLTEFNPTGAGATLFNRMSGNGPGVTNDASAVAAAKSQGWEPSDTDDNIKGMFWIPLNFWFCRNTGLSLPLIALQYHEVKVKINFEELNNLAIANENNNNTFSAGDTVDAVAGSGNLFDLWCDYIYLDTDERRRFAQVSHEYLIEQLQYISANDTTIELNFNHPVKELILTGVRQTDTNTNIPSMFQRNALDGTLACTYNIKLNGHDRFSERHLVYFTRTQRYQHHKKSSNRNATGENDTIAVYSFALNPEEHQPSGTCNFSRIDNAELIQTGGTQTPMNIYAVNYNVLRIMSGMGGLAYSN